jgi:hypothetical protein
MLGSHTWNRRWACSYNLRCFLSCTCVVESYCKQKMVISEGKCYACHSKFSLIMKETLEADEVQESQFRCTAPVSKR